MSQVEVVMTGYSIIVALAIARLLDGFRPMLTPGAVYWPHSLWVVNKLINVLVIYWSTWYFIAESINFAQFLLVLAPPAIVYLQCDALLSKRPQDVSDWRAYFYKNRRFFFIANALLGISLITQLLLASNQSYPINVLVLLGVLTVVSFIGIIFANQRLHAVIAVMGFFVLSAGFAAQLSTLSPR